MSENSPSTTVARRTLTRSASEGVELRRLPRWRFGLVSRITVALMSIALFASAAAPAQQPAPAAQPAAQKAVAEKPNPPEKPADERKLKFNFRFQRWADVLEWFAQQSDLSLVLDAPPPGTFNYSDNREYTPAEAIDLLNGVLLTKGYTLLRRDRMLLVVNLADGLPIGAVPRVSLDELDRRGKYEFVSVLFPLGKRSAEEVNKEIAPLLGAHGKSVPLPATRQLLVTDTAGVMRAIHAVIESIAEPSQPGAAPADRAATGRLPGEVGRRGDRARRAQGALARRQVRARSQNRPDQRPGVTRCNKWSSRACSIRCRPPTRPTSSRGWKSTRCRGSTSSLRRRCSRLCPRRGSRPMC